MSTISGAIRITIPVKVAANIKTLKTSLETIAERLGCRPCFSGADCFLQLERNYLIDEKAKLALLGNIDIEPVGLTPWPSSMPVVVKSSSLLQV